jgi:hypothetical protein
MPRLRAMFDENESPQGGRRGWRSVCPPEGQSHPSPPSIQRIPSSLHLIPRAGSRS